MHAYIHVLLYVCMHVCVYVCMYTSDIHKYIYKQHSIFTIVYYYYTNSLACVNNNLFAVAKIQNIHVLLIIGMDGAFINLLTYLLYQSG